MIALPAFTITWYVNCLRYKVWLILFIIVFSNQYRRLIAGLLTNKLFLFAFFIILSMVGRYAILCEVLCTKLGAQSEFPIRQCSRRGHDIKLMWMNHRLRCHHNTAHRLNLRLWRIEMLDVIDDGSWILNRNDVVLILVLLSVHLYLLLDYIVLSQQDVEI